MALDTNSFLVHRPPWRLSLIVSAAVAIAWGLVQTLIYPDAVMPLTYALPLLLGVWTMDKRLLWGMAAVFVAMATAKVWWIMPAAALPASLDWAVYLAQLINILIAAMVVHAIVSLRDHLQRRNAALADANQRLIEANERISQQNEELHAQSEELTQQNEQLRQQGEELEQQTEELNEQSDELRTGNEALTRQEEILRTLLSASGSAAGAQEVLSELCEQGIKLLGGSVTAAAVIVVRHEQACVEAQLGLMTDAAASIDGNSRHSLARLVIAEDRTAALDDIALRPDLVFPRAPDGSRFQAVLAAPVHLRGQVQGTIEFYSPAPLCWTDAQFRLAEWVAAQCGVVLETAQLRGELGEQQRRFDAVLSSIQDFVCIFDGDDRFVYANKMLLDLWGLSADQVLGKTMRELGYAPEVERTLLEGIRQVRQTGQIVRNQTHYTSPTGISGDYDNIFSPMFANDGRIKWVAGSSRDIRDMLRRQEEVQRLNRTLKALSESSKLMGRAQEEQQYLQEVCRIVVDDCGYAMVWIGYAQDDADKSVRPVAWCGFEQGYLEDLRVTWSDSERGRGPTGTAIRTGQMSLCENMQTDPRLAPWRNDALRRGYASSIALPLSDKDGTFGALTIYARQPAAFPPSETQLLRELADDLAYGIVAIRLRKANRQAEAALRKGLRRVELLASAAGALLRSPNPSELIEPLCRQMLEHLDCQVFLNFLLDEQVGQLRLHCFDGLSPEQAGRIEWRELGATMCGRTVQGARPIVAERIAPGDPCAGPISGFGIRAYAAIPLIGPGEAAFGALCFGSRTRDSFTDDDLSLMRAIADHVAVALVREQTEAKLVSARTSAEQAKEDAEAASKAKDHFLAVLSHELRTPLNPALMAATILENHPQLPPDLREDAGVIRRNVELEARLIDDMLDLTRIARGKMALNRQVIDAREVLRHAVEICHGEAVEKDLALDVVLPPGPVLVDGDPARLQQIFWNLLKNAIKFTPSHGHIALSAGASGGRLLVRVSDTGKGVEQELLDRIFDAFEQGSAQATHRYGGLGLGLAICKGLVGMHDGSISAASDGPGKGAVFTVDLPLAGATDTGALPPSARGAESPSPGAQQGACSILLVEDHESTARMTARLLRSFGHQVMTADCVRSAVDIFEQQSFDLVISDLGLPDGSGRELLQQLLARRYVRAIALSGYGMENDITESAAAGFMEHLIKPINARQLDDAIKRAMGLGACDAASSA